MYYFYIVPRERTHSYLTGRRPYQVFGNFDRAEALFDKASRIQSKVLGASHPHSVATLQVRI